MSDANNRVPPPDVQEAARKVDAWLKGQPAVVPTGIAAQRPESAADRFKHARDIDQKSMPAWKDPRTP
jgi:hypothetical protein